MRTETRIERWIGHVWWRSGRDMVAARRGKWEGSAVPAIEGKHIGGNVDEIGDHLMTSASSTVSICSRYRYIETYFYN